MARRKSQGMSVNLFPFLSILVAIIGCLTLIIVVINVTQLNKGKEGQTPEDVVRAQEFKLLEKEREEKQTLADNLRKQIDELIQETRDTIAKREKLQRLKLLKDNQEEIDATRNELIAKINAFDNTIKKLDKEHPVLLTKIEELKKEIAKRDLPPEPPKLRIRPSGSGRDRFPFFVEAANNAVMIHNSLSNPPIAVPLASLNQNKDFSELLKSVASRDSNRLIFLIRGNKESARSYDKAVRTISSYNRENGSEIIPGRLPIPAEGAVDLTPFKQYFKD